MAGKPKPVVQTAQERVKARELDDRIKRIREKTPTCDPTGEHHASLRIIAEHAGKDVGDLIDEWHERAGAREFGRAGNTDPAWRAECERLAVIDIEAVYAPMQGLLL